MNRHTNEQLACLSLAALLGVMLTLSAFFPSATPLPYLQQQLERLSPVQVFAAALVGGTLLVLATAAAVVALAACFAALRGGHVASSTVFVAALPVVGLAVALTTTSLLAVQWSGGDGCVMCNTLALLSAGAYIGCAFSRQPALAPVRAG